MSEPTAYPTVVAQPSRAQGPVLPATPALRPDAEAHVATWPSRRSGPATRTAIAIGLILAALLLGLMTAIHPVLGLGGFLALAVAATAVRDASIAVYAFVFATFFQNIVGITGPALSPIKIFGALLVVFALVLVAQRVHDRGRWRPAWAGRTVFLTGSLGLVAYGAASIGWAANSAEVIQWTSSLATDVVIMLAVGVIIHTPAQVIRLLQVILAAATVATVWGLADPGLLVAERLAGTLGDPNEYAAAGIVAIACGYALYGIHRAPLARLVVAAATITVLYGVLQSQSRGGLLGLAVMGVILLVTSDGRERVRVAGAALVLVAVVIAFLASPAGEAFMTRFEEEDSSGRADLWSIAVDEFLDHPVIGVGLGNYIEEASNYLDAGIQRVDLVRATPTRAHSLYLEWLAELGVVGFTLVLMVLVSTLRMYVRALGRSRGMPQRRFAIRGLLAATAGMLVCQAFISGQYMELLWILIALAPVSLVLAPRDEEGAVPVAPVASLYGRRS